MNAGVLIGLVDGQDKWGEEQEQGKMKERLFYHSLAEREAALDVLRKTGVSGGRTRSERCESAGRI